MPQGSRPALPPDARLTLVTLGRAELRLTSGETTDGATLFELGKPLALITYIACAPDRAAPREHLIDLLWGDVEPEGAKHALRQTLWYIRKRLGERPLITGGDTLTLAGPVDCDRDEFLAAVERGDAEAVVRTFTGDFFPGFAAPGGAEFERWADIERQRLRSLFWRSAETLVRRWMSTAKIRDAQQLARRVRDTDPLREAGWRLLFETLIAGGDAVGGAIEADAYDRLAASEGLQPEPATRALLRTVRHTAAPPENSTGGEERPALAAELVGREQEFAQLLAAWEAARGGRAMHVHVLAAAGLGKTRLLSDVHARLRATRARTLFVRASLGAREIPFGLAGDVAEALAKLPGASGISTGSARALVALNPALSASYPAATPDASADSVDALRSRTVAVRELVAAVAEEQPIAIFIDDTQWADTRSRQLIAGVVGALERVRVLIVTASRPTADAMSGSEHPQTIRLAPLTVGGVAALVESIGALPSEPWAEHVASELRDASGGSPLLVLETLHLAMEGGVLSRTDQGWHSSDPVRLFTALQAGSALRRRVERLDRIERWIMTLLAVAGVPVSRETLTVASGRGSDETGAALGSLERRGFAARHDDVWSPSHDEIAAMAVELASEDARRAAARALGRVMLDARPRDTRVLRTAAGLLAQARDRESLALAFGRFVYLAREAGDRQSNRVLAYDFLGERATAPEAAALTRSLPLPYRLGVYTGTRLGIAVALALLFPLGVALNRSITRQPPPDVVVAIGTVSPDSLAAVYEVPIRAAQLAPGSTVPVRSRFGERWRLLADPTQGTLVRRPGAEAWVIDRVSRDSGGIDLYELADNGRERRLTESRGDDQGAVFSPDGQQMAFFTARWSAESHYAIAVRDMRTGVVRRLTRGDDSNISPLWSPDGSRIAFTRQYWDGRPHQACVIDVDGTGERCFGSGQSRLTTQGAWYDENHVFVDMPSAVNQLLGRLDVQTGAMDTLLIYRPGESLTMSPDGRWVMCHCRRIGFSARALLLFPIDEPNRAVELDVRGLPEGRRLLAFERTARRDAYADRVVMDHGAGPPIAGIPHLFTAHGVTPRGDTVAVGSVRWRSLDTAIATIDTAGVLFAPRPGTVRLAATLGGWRTASDTFEVRAPEIRLLLQEDWANGISTPWRAFGDPRPSIDTATDGFTSFLNGGEGSFMSGVYSVQRYSISRGLALDTWISDSVTSNHWQLTSIALEDGIDDAALRRWDHTVGNIPRRRTDYPACGIGYPAEEGATYGQTLAFTEGILAEGMRLPAPPSFRAGAWFHVRLQVFPDGRCGIAINGAPVARSSERIVTDTAVRMVIMGNSVNTKVLVGPVTLRAGVPMDIDWSRPTPRVPNAPPAGMSPRRQ